MGEQVEKGIGILSRAKEKEKCIVKSALDQVFKMMGYPEAWFESELNRSKISKYEIKNVQSKDDDGAIHADVEVIWSIDGEALFKTITHRTFKFKDDFYDVSIKIYDINNGNEIEMK